MGHYLEVEEAIILAKGFPDHSQAMLPKGISMKTMDYATIDHVIICYHTEEQPTNEEWARFVEYRVERTRARKDSVLVVESDGGGPNAGQRALAVNAIRAAELPFDACPTVAFTNSRLGRGIVTVLKWMGANLSAYSLDEHEKGLRAVGLDAQQIDKVVARINALRAGCR